MDLIVRGIRQALELLLRGDAEVMEIMWLSLRVSGLATALSLLVGVPVGMALAHRAARVSRPAVHSRRHRRGPVRPRRAGRGRAHGRGGATARPQAPGSARRARRFPASDPRLAAA